MPGCPSETTILAFVEGALTSTARGELETHLAGCDECRMLVSELARSDARGTEDARAADGPSTRDVGERDTSLAPHTPRRSSRPPLAPVTTGDVLAGKYVVERVLGVGGMGVVVSAMHRELAQRVAIKFLLPHAFEASGAHARFLREARAAASLKSEHVARVSDVGTLESGAPYMVMEFLDGVDFGEHLRRERTLPADEAVSLVLQACEAIAEAHAAGIVHRDLKPANLFLTQRADGSPLVKVLDFGISKADGGSQGTLTTATAMMGSPRYMSPEQLRSAHEVDARTDVWALGVILYELVAGMPPFRGDSMIALCTSIATDAATPLRKVAPAAPEALERAIAGCLEKREADRTPTIAALAEALRPIAPEGARASIERIARIGAGGGARATTTGSVARVAEKPHGLGRVAWIAGACGLVGAIAFFATRATGPATPPRPTTATAPTAAASTAPPSPTTPTTAAATAGDPSASAAPTDAPSAKMEPKARPPAARVKPAPDGGRTEPAEPSATAAAAASAAPPVGQSGLLDRK